MSERMLSPFGNKWEKLISNFDKMSWLGQNFCQRSSFIISAKRWNLASGKSSICTSFSGNLETYDMFLVSLSLGCPFHNLMCLYHGRERHGRLTSSCSILSFPWRRTGWQCLIHWRRRWESLACAGFLRRWGFRGNSVCDFLNGTCAFVLHDQDDSELSSLISLEISFYLL